MGMADDLRGVLNPDGSYTVSGKNYLQPITFSPEQVQALVQPKIDYANTIYDQKVAALEKVRNRSAQDIQDDFDRVGLTQEQAIANAMQQVEASRGNIGEAENFAARDLDGRGQGISWNLIEKYGLNDQVNKARGQYLDSQKSSSFGRFAKVAGPLAALAGGLVLAPALLGGGGAAAAGGATSAGTISGAGISEGLLAAKAGLGAGAGYSATLGSAAAGGLGATLGNFASKQALSGAVRGGISGYASGGDLSSALKGAGLGAAAGGFGEGLGQAAQLQGAGLEAFKGGLTGSSGALANGDMRGAALGGAAGAGMGYYQGGGFGQQAGTALDKASGIAGAQGPTQGTGLAGAVTRTTNPITNSLSNFTGGGGSSFTGGNMNNLGQALKLGGSIYGDYTNRQTNKDIERRLLDANSQAAQQMQPYQQAGLSAQQQLSQALAAGFNPSDLQNDPGYQFQLEQGERALGRGMSAQGMTQSGAALKALQEHGQGVASTRYNDAYNQWLQQNKQLQNVANTGMGAAGGLAELQYNSGQVQADRLNKNRDSRSELIAALTGMFA